MQAKAFLVSTVLLLFLLSFTGCDPIADTDLPAENSTDTQTDTADTEVPRPEGWTKETHGKKGEPDYEKIFPDNKVNRLDITISASDWKEMLDDIKMTWGSKEGSNGTGNIEAEKDEAADEAADEPGCGGGDIPHGFPDENPVYKTCTVEFEGKTWHHVGIRFKGNSSLHANMRSGSLKYPLRLTFDQFEDDFPEIDDQRFYGFQKVSMSSNYSDKSFLREKVVADIFRDAGVPAPHTAFYRVFIDYGEGSKYFGLYTMVEIPDKPMLKLQFSDSGGNLYKPIDRGATFSTYVEEDFDKETNKKEADYSDVRALHDALNADRTDASAWRADLERTLNVDGFLRWLAVNTTIQNWDTYGTMTHNYYLYNDPADTQLHWIPWDNNMALTGGQAPPLELPRWRIGNTWPLIRYLIDDPVYHAKYVNYVEEAAAKTFNPERMRPIYKAAHDMIRPYVVGEEGEVSGYTLLSKKEDFDNGLEYLNKHVQQRYDAALTFVKENQP